MQIRENIGFSRRMWMLERAGWIVMGLFVLSAVLGLTGDGPLSSTQTASPEGGVVRYNRFLRLLAQAPLEIEVRRENGTGHAVQLQVNRVYLKEFHIKAITPGPLTAEFQGEFIVYTFPAAEGGQPLLITFNMQAQKIGRKTASFGKVGGKPARFSQMVFM